MEGPHTFPESVHYVTVLSVAADNYIHPCTQRFHSTETQVQHGGFRSITSLLFIVSFPALCLALLSTQTGDAIT